MTENNCGMVHSPHQCKWLNSLTTKAVNQIWLVHSSGECLPRESREATGIKTASSQLEAKIPQNVGFLSRYAEVREHLRGGTGGGKGTGI
jgi:hypothetical protein